MPASSRVTYTVEFLKTAAEELAGLPKDAQRQIMKRVGVSVWRQRKK